MSYMSDQEFEKLEREYELLQSVRHHVCVCCNTRMFFDTSNPTTNGQVYSVKGAREVSISGFCEYCFDKITMVED